MEEVMLMSSVLDKRIHKSAYSPVTPKSCSSESFTADLHRELLLVGLRWSLMLLTAAHHPSPPSHLSTSVTLSAAPVLQRVLGKQPILVYSSASE